MNEQTFVDRVNSALPLAQSAKVIIDVFEKHHIFGFDNDPDLYVVAPKDSTHIELAVMIVFRNAIEDAKYSKIQTKQELKRIKAQQGNPLVNGDHYGR